MIKFLKIYGARVMSIGFLFFLAGCLWNSIGATSATILITGWIAIRIMIFFVCLLVVNYNAGLESAENK